MNNTSRTSVRTLVMLALLVAMSIVFSRVLSISTGFVRFNLGSLPVLLAALLFGPGAGFAVGAVADIIGGVLVGIGFDVGGPSFCKAGGAEKISDVGGFLALEGDSLVKMPRESFMCQCAEKLQRRGMSGIVDIDYVGGSGIHRRCEVKSRT